MNYYEILEVSSEATQEDIERAYRKKALQHHPDRNPGDVEAHSKFIEVQKAYDTLKEHANRTRYNQSLQQPESFGSADFFEQENLDIKIIYKITILESILGTQKTVTVSKKQPCNNCFGFGATTHRVCDSCHGRGHIVNAMNTIFHFQTLCGRCFGHGKIATNRCDKCLGQKKINTPEISIDFAVPKGIQDNMTLCLNGQGNVGLNGRVGNLYIQCALEQDQIFKIEGLNVVCNIKTKFSTMVFGGKVEIPTPENDVVEIDIPAKTECLTKLRIKNKGMYDVRNLHNRGDIVATIIVDMPQNFSDSQIVKNFLISHGI